MRTAVKRNAHCPQTEREMNEKDVYLFIYIEDLEQTDFFKRPRYDSRADITLNRKSCVVTPLNDLHAHPIMAIG